MRRTITTMGDSSKVVKATGTRRRTNQDTIVPVGGMTKFLRAKLHGIRVTGADLDYEGSILLDPEHCAIAGIVPFEFVDVWNKTNGERLSTYVIFGEPGSRCCVLNGAAARLCQVGDELIIAAHVCCDLGQKDALQPVVLEFRPGNDVKTVRVYSVSRGSNGRHAVASEVRTVANPSRTRRGG